MVQIADDGVLMLRLKNTTVLDGTVLKEEWHRTSVVPGEDADVRLAEVNTELGTRGFSAVTSRDIGLVKSIETEVHTPEVIDAYRQKLAAGRSR